MSSTDDIDMKPLIAMVATGRPLSEADAARAFEAIMSGNATPAQMGAFLMALRVRGETVEEITAAARIMRAKATPITAPEGAIDLVGTGGDCAGTYNISTAAALVTAACGVPVAKHGNRAASSKSGSADVLAALGINLEAEPTRVEASLREVGIGFMFAQRHHSAMKHVAPVRGELGTRTLFNLLGPLANPAGARFELMGVFADTWVEPLAQVLGRLGAERAWVVHGSDGLDEVTTTGPTLVAEYRAGVVRRFTITPGDAGLPVAKPEDLKGGDPATNADAVRALLAGQPGPYRDIVVLNAAAALVVAGRASSLSEGAAQAQAAIDSGKALDVLTRMVAVTNGTGS
ncbi:anthranilate phosphoribosyltransferase [Pararhodospirillum photometricum]|uniref:Anthranilate phosphoribosyltransferase n=1 Tax=Pararhodospirillum photometricum DSM 122 TaxID=1150469 RepID=H6SPP9_PARPM|nr:anthranilate phosphoribosyltransferase [Pararhodospirillum photometricum]CCG07169.1 Anthranilate phosphoribosyltransferase [Pararhodospirillum photometricum DSM 122]